MALFCFQNLIILLNVPVLVRFKSIICQRDQIARSQEILPIKTTEIIESRKHDIEGALKLIIYFSKN